MGVQFTGDVPFREIVIHGLVRASDGRKMSKSLNNIVDPFEMIEQYGADALRLSLLQSASPGHDVPFDVSWVDASRRFGNKLWNATRFALIHLPAGSLPAAGGYPEAPGPVDRWILARLGEVAERFDELSDAHRLSDAFSLMYSFAWSEVFDWYIEMSKPALSAGGPEAGHARQTLGVVMRDLLKFFHPAIPFVTEELYSHLVAEELLIVSSWPEVPRYAAPDGMEALQDLITALRGSRSDHGWSAGEALKAVIHDPQGAWRDWWAPQLASLAGIEARVGTPPESSGYLRVAAGPVEAYVEVRGVIDIEAEQERLGRRLGKARAALQQSETKLSNPAFRARAPGKVVAKEEQKAVASRALVDKLVSQLEALGDVVG